MTHSDKLNLMPSTEEIFAIVLNPDSDSSMLPAPYCSDSWHDKYHDIGEFCPNCLSLWWTTIPNDFPYDPAFYWLQIIARRSI